MRRATRILLIALPAVILWNACSNESSIGPGPVVAIFTNPDSLTVDVGLQSLIQAFALDKDSSALIDKKLTFVSANTAVATVDDSGLVTAVALGADTVTVSADGVSRKVPVSVSLPDIDLASDTLYFTATSLGADPAAQTDSIHSQRGGAIAGMAVGTITYGAGATGWVGSATLSATAAPARISVAVATGALTAGTYLATVPITSPSVAATKNLILSFTVNPPGPRIGLSTAALNFAAQIGTANPPAQTVNITNAGGGTLDQLSLGTIVYGAGATGWLGTASLSTTTAPATLTVQPTTGALAAGTYTATIPIVSPVATNTPQNVTVTFDVLAISFANDVQPIFTASCTGCHFTGGQKPDLSLNNSYAAIVGVASTTVACGGQIYVVAGSPATSLLQQKIDSTQTCGSRMPLPLSSPGLSQASRDIIRKWIQAGAANN